MTLDNALRKQFYHALLSAFPQIADLEMLVDFGLGENLGQIAGDATGKSIVYKLITWCENQGRLIELIEVASKENPRNPELCGFMSCYRQVTIVSASANNVAPHPLPIPAVEPQSPAFPEACHFDLNLLIQDCREALYGQTGLIGFTIPCPEPTFQEHFCERLRQDLGRKATKKRSPLVIDVNITPEQVVSRVRGFKSDLLKDYDVICPLPIHVFQKDSALPDLVWQALSAEFKAIDLKRRLIVVMFGGEKTVFPQGPIRMSPPQFKEVDVHYWVGKVANSLGWSEQAWEKWKHNVVADCLGDPTCGALEIWKVYDRLDLSLKLLQSHQIADDFLRALASELKLRG